MRGLAGLAWLAMVVMPLVATGAQAQEREATSEFIVGSGGERVRFSGTPDKDGLVFLFGVPADPTEDWPVAVLNTTDQPLLHLEVRVYEIVEGKGKIFDERVPIFPQTLFPGEFGFGAASRQQDGSDAPTGPRNGRAAELRGRMLGERLDSTLEDLRILDPSVEEDRLLRGRVRNETGFSIGGIWVHRLCVDESGDLTAVQTRPVARATLETDDERTVEVDFGEECEYASYTAVGRRT